MIMMSVDTQLVMFTGSKRSSATALLTNSSLQTTAELPSTVKIEEELVVTSTHGITAPASAQSGIDNSTGGAERGPSGLSMASGQDLQKTSHISSQEPLKLALTHNIMLSLL